MGQACSTPTPTPKTRTKPKTKVPLTFGKDPNLNMKDFMVTNETNKVIRKQSKGQQFLCEECFQCDITVNDKIAALTVDLCKKSNFLFGPVESSAFIRNCTDCVFVVACLQFRTRECKNCTFFLYSSTEPIIETSSNILIGCYNHTYEKLQADFEDCNLSVWNNKWSEVYDFTPPSNCGNNNSTNWKSLDMSTNINYQDFYNEIPTATDASDIALELESEGAISVGAEVTTVYGVGEVKEIRASDALYKVVLTDWFLTNGSEVFCFLNQDAIQLSSSESSSLFTTPVVNSVSLAPVIPITVGKNFLGETSIDMASTIPLFLIFFPACNPSSNEILSTILTWCNSNPSSVVVRTRKFTLSSEQCQALYKKSIKNSVGSCFGLELRVSCEVSKDQLLASLSSWSDDSWSCEGRATESCCNNFFHAWKEQQ